MLKMSGFIVAAALLAAGQWGFAAESAPVSSLSAQPVAGFKTAQVATAANFAAYTAVWVQTPEVSFDRDWLQTHAFDITPADRQNMATHYGAALQRALNKQLANKSAFVLASQADAKTLVIKPQLLDLFFTAPELSTPGRKDVYVAQVGRATLKLTLIDGASGQVLAQLEDSGQTRNRIGEALVKADRARNFLDFRLLMEHWGHNLRNYLKPTP